MSKINNKDLETLRKLFEDEWFDFTDQQILEEAEKLLNITSLLLSLNYKGDDK